MPGADFTMVLLLIDGRIVDWASCWSYNRTACHEVLLEDVTRDGHEDVAFRASEGFFGLSDERQHSLPGDDRRWLYAYRITDKGLQSIFPATERDLKVSHSYDSAGQPVKLEAKGLPDTLRERQMVECVLTMTNTSTKELEVGPGRCFQVQIKDLSYWMQYGPPGEKTVLKPGESTSRSVRLFVQGCEKEAAFHWRFVPN
jgi:hypothetical protein